MHRVSKATVDRFNGMVNFGYSDIDFYQHSIDFDFIGCMYGYTAMLVDAPIYYFHICFEPPSAGFPEKRLLGINL